MIKTRMAKLIEVAKLKLDEEYNGNHDLYV